MRGNKGAKGLTAQAGLIPVVKFLQKQGVEQLIKETVHHQRGATALYDAVDAIFLPLVAIIGGARSIRAIVTVWSDTILSRAAGWLNIPDETTFGRLFRTFSQRHINDLEVLVHRFRGKIWRKTLRAGKSKIAAAPCMTIDVDSTEKTVAHYGFRGLLRIKNFGLTYKSTSLLLPSSTKSHYRSCVLTNFRIYYGSKITS